MAKYVSVSEEVFVALAAPTRGAVIRRPGPGPASVGELARALPVILPSFMKHVRTLEASGPIRTVKPGRVRMCTLDRGRRALVDDWLGRLWEARTAGLERLVAEQEESS
ncbi:MAG: helix-turn-helix domain-containing protein [Trueperaceae bacterium]|nr:helix-turn-helix domain-containing protein [Trueperaceae bacterium]